ncbi:MULTISPECIES: Rid family hydrolase [Pseudomonas]|jgi:enamine deaminase RidA (YjgF/YER057c/UK114 family)|uniref:RidA family protein n=1 Tax=Pseudomonas haemolytica TaxID=2600065 RepID=A0A5P1DAT9_9PSED|nr:MULTISPECIES: Rid family hydrolase [Pseudomonas]MBJ2245815.1 RidA family protein [Pseudomonas haemolytica]MBJ2273511.1 RidA family protein [Pseudomonas haemolytica]MBJ2285695.1 RidA family protein [Pseudomonas sp. MF6755]MBK3449212.1 RidA family protein [Pseudomonas haemolytica]MBK3460508.1 RidA family protein [Pseudomonas haemolytica]
MNPVVVAPAGASWSNALLIGREVVMSGMTAHPASREATLDCYAQTLVVLGKIQALVEAAGGHIGTIYRLTVYLTDIADKDQVGRARRDFFGGQAVFPTSTLVAVSALVFPELRVEIEASARLDVDLRTVTEVNDV